MFYVDMIRRRRKIYTSTKELKFRVFTKGKKIIELTQVWFKKIKFFPFNVVFRNQKLQNKKKYEYSKKKLFVKKQTILIKSQSFF